MGQRPFAALLSRMTIAAGLLLAGSLVAGASQNPGQATNLRPNHAKHLCLTFAPTLASLAVCDGSNAQKVVIRRKAANYVTLTVGRKCVQAGRNEGASLSLAGCSNSIRQTWTTTNSGQLKSETGYCADVREAQRTAGTPVIGYRCTGAENQRWARYNPETAGNAPDITVNQMLTPKSAPGKCLQAAGLQNSQIAIFDCKGAKSQRFSFNWQSKTKIRVDGKCLFDHGGSQLRLGICRDNDRSQLWDVMTGGEIRSSRGLCLDVKENGLSNGTPIILYQCQNQPNQRFQIR